MGAQDTFGSDGTWWHKKDRKALTNMLTAACCKMKYIASAHIEDADMALSMALIFFHKVSYL